jgi:hypothetical protein
MSRTGQKRPYSQVAESGHLPVRSIPAIRMAYSDEHGPGNAARVYFQSSVADMPLQKLCAAEMLALPWLNKRSQ